MSSEPIIRETRRAGEQKPGEAKEGVLRLRAMLVAIPLAVIDSYWVIQMEKIRPGPYATTISIFANAVFILTLLVALNSIRGRWRKRPVFSQAELLLIYVMVCMGASLAGHDMIPVLIQMMAHPFRYATPENAWMPLFGDHLPLWLIVSDPDVLKGYFEGNSTLYTREVLTAWVPPALRWCGFTVVLVFVMMCINTLVRRQWMENERLTFPVVQLPLAMTEPGGALWCSKMMWMGFAVAGGISLLNGLAMLYPSIPRIPVKHEWDLASFVVTPPWNALGWTPISFYPFVIGLGYLLPTDLAFSCWFFFLFGKLQLVISRAMAWDTVPQFPFLKNQSIGGCAGIVALMLWSARGFLKRMLLHILGRGDGLDDSQEPMSYRTAALGAIAGSAVLIAVVAQIGLSPVIGVVAFAVYFAISTAIARMRAELGPPVHDLSMSGPDELIPQSVGTQNMGAGNLTALSYLYWFNRAYRGHPMAIGIEGMKMAQAARADQRRFLIGVMVAVAVGSVAAFWMYLHLAYSLGCASKFATVHNWPMGTSFGAEPHLRLESWLRNPSPPDTGANAATLSGFAFALFLGVMRMQFVSWPFHPIGFAISGGFTMRLVWLPILISWLVKIAVLRVGGLKLYRALLPLFLGLIIGEMIIGCLWSLVGIAFNVQTYSFWGQ